MIKRYICWLTIMVTSQSLAIDFSPATPLPSAALQDNHVVSKIGFGSCFDPQKDDQIFEIIGNQQPDLFLMIGDNVYPESETHDPSLQSLRNAYGKLAESKRFARLRDQIPLMATWDDHDFGLNDGGGDWPLRSTSEALFEHVWVPEGDARRTRDGIYFSSTIGPVGRRVQFIVLDTRSFRSPLLSSPNPLIARYQPDDSLDKTMLGDAQWAWLEAILEQPADVRILVSSVQVIADGHAWEAWRMLPNERKRLYTLIRTTGAQGVIILSGDRHSAGLYRRDDITSYPLWEMTSSSLNLPLTSFVPKITQEPGPFREGDNYFHVNFGMLEINWEDRHVILSIRDRRGQPMRDTLIRL